MIRVVLQSLSCPSVKKVALHFLLIFVLLACDSNRVYEDNLEFVDRAWKVIEEPRFEFTVPNSSLQYNLYYNVRNSLDFPYARIFVRWHLYDSTGKEIAKKLVFNDLFDEKTG